MDETQEVTRQITLTHLLKVVPGLAGAPDLYRGSIAVEGTTWDDDVKDQLESDLKDLACLRFVTVTNSTVVYTVRGEAGTTLDRSVSDYLHVPFGTANLDAKIAAMLQSDIGTAVWCVIGDALGEDADDRLSDALQGAVAA